MSYAYVVYSYFDRVSILNWMYVEFVEQGFGHNELLEIAGNRGQRAFWLLADRLQFA